MIKRSILVIMLIAFLSPISIVSPAELVYGFGSYTNYRIKRMDKAQKAGLLNSNPVWFDHRPNFKPEEIEEMRQFVDQYDQTHTIVGSTKQSYPTISGR